MSVASCRISTVVGDANVVPPGGVTGGRPSACQCRIRKDHWYGQGGELQPVLERLHERDRAHPAERDVGRDHQADQQRTPGVRPAGDRGERQARAL
jgi:hypothetical protein